MNLVQTLQSLEDLEVSDGSENDSGLEIEHQDVTKIFIQPPIDSNEKNSDVDSGGEEDPSKWKFTFCSCVTCGERCKER